MASLFENEFSFASERSDGEDSDGLLLYLQRVRQLPFLTAEQESALVQSWFSKGDPKAAEQLINSHLRLVVKTAFGFRGYGFPLNDLIAEGNIGLIKSLKRFNPEKGVRFATYALWWIRSSIQEYVLSAWSLVKIGTTAAQKRLFFSLRKIKAQLAQFETKQTADVLSQETEIIAERLNVSKAEVTEMEKRLKGPDRSLNTPITVDGLGEWQDFLIDDSENQETSLIRADQEQKRERLLNQALRMLTEREYLIFKERQLMDRPATLENLANQYGISRERVRQIEDKAYKKISKAVKNLAYQEKLVAF